MGCVTSVPPETHTTISKIASRSATDDSYSTTIEVLADSVIDSDDQMNRFITKYKLHVLADTIFSEGITMDFLLSQDAATTLAIAQQLTDNVIQQNKFIFGCTAEKAICHHRDHCDDRIQIQRVYTQSRSDSMHSIFPMDTMDAEAIRIYIESTETEETKPLDVSTVDTIESVKLLYLQKYDPLHRLGDLSLSYCGAEMKNGHTLDDYGVIPDTELHLEFQVKLHRECIANPGSRRNRVEDSMVSGTAISRELTSSYSSSKSSTKMTVFVQMKRHRKCVLKLDVSEGMKVKRLQRKIERQWGISTANQRLLFNEEELVRNERVRDHALSAGDTIFLTKQLGLYSVFLKIKLHPDDESSSSSVSKPITIGFERRDTIYNIKLQIQLFLQIPALQQRYDGFCSLLSESSITGQAAQSILQCTGYSILGRS